eukprot:TRINITY_DN70963_c0_g1_i1.p1 TRINITY_DN70963_c0_g1~~TRINITY_DN70963_c0_g1_i1.p1  ORF type:complete len:272 (+),score=98.50 TRINITY_DN70963_c0_g1_i1:106-816(+)
MAAPQRASAAVPFKRREWDTRQYREKGAEREEQERAAAAAAAERAPGKRVDRRAGRYPELKPKQADGAPQRDWLTARDQELHLSETIGRSSFVNQDGKSISDQPGWYCKLCDCVLRDSLTYLDHINGKKHQRMKGVSMRVKEAELDTVQRRLVEIKERSEQDDETRALEVEHRARQKQIDWAERDGQRREQEKDRKKRRKEALRKEEEEGTEEVGGDEAMMRMMGFGSFGGGAKRR